MTTGFTVVPVGAASRNIWVSMPETADGSVGGVWPSVENPQISIVRGIDESASGSTLENGRLDTALNPGSRGVNTTCLQVVSLPKPNVWEYAPSRGPQSVHRAASGDSTYYGYPKPGDELLSGGYSFDSDLELAKRQFSQTDVIYCLDMDWFSKQQLAADQAKKDAKKNCGATCVIAMVVYGAIEGFIIGGPYGAIVGAFVGLAVGIASAADPEFYQRMLKAWDEIAGFYNKVFDTVLTYAVKLSGICELAGAANKKAGEACTEGAKTVGAAIISYYTGIPPRLATGAEIEAAADGQIEAFIVQGLNALLSSLGVSCDTFTVDGDAARLALSASDVDTGGIDDVARNSDGDISACTAIARTFVRELRKAMDTRQGQIMAGFSGKAFIPGLVISPVSDSSPSLTITAPAGADHGSGVCPVVVNTTVTEAGWSFRFTAIETRMLWSAASTIPFTTTSVPERWSATLALRLYATADYYNYTTDNSQFGDNHRTVVQTRPTGGEPYAHITIDSPCFASTYVLDADKYFDVGDPQPWMFMVDKRPAKAYF